MADPAQPHRLDNFDHHDPQFVDDPVPIYREMREQCPLAHTDAYGGFWMLTRYDDVMKGLLDWKTFTSSVVNTTAIPSTFERDFPALPNELDPPEHTIYRSLISDTFKKSRIQGLRPVIESVAREKMTRIVQEGRGDIAADFATPISLGSLGALLELPDEDRGLWGDWVDRMFNALVDADDATLATTQLYDYIDALVADRRSNPRDDLISELLAAEVEGISLTDLEVRGFYSVLLNAGHETTSGGISGMMHFLAENPEHFEALVASADLLPTAVEEFIRFVTPIQLLARNTTCPVDLHGRTIPEGAVVAMGYASANRDVEAFPNPDNVVLDRRPNRHVAFGAGRHLCVGAHLARLELTIALETLVEMVSTMRLDPKVAVTWKGRGDVRAHRCVPVVVEAR